MDLKPQNIVLANKPVTNNSKNGNSTDLTQPEDKLKIIDFGLARALGPPGRVSTVVELQQFLYFDEQPATHVKSQPFDFLCGARQAA